LPCEGFSFINDDNWGCDFGNKPEIKLLNWIVVLKALNLNPKTELGRKGKPQDVGAYGLFPFLLKFSYLL